MALATARLVLLVVLVAGSSCGGSARRGPLTLSRLRMLPTAQYAVEAAAEGLKEDVSSAAPLIHALHPLLGSAADFSRRAGVPCDSWRLAVETYNKRDWTTVPASCEGYVGHYMLGGHYRRDSRVVVDEAVAYAKALNLGGNGKEVWVFDIDETSLSNLPYYAKHGFGARRQRRRRICGEESDLRRIYGEEADPTGPHQIRLQELHRRARPCADPTAASRPGPIVVAAGRHRGRRTHHGLGRCAAFAPVASSGCSRRGAPSGLPRPWPGCRRAALRRKRYAGRRSRRTRAAAAPTSPSVSTCTGGPRIGGAMDLQSPSKQTRCVT